MNHFCTCPTFSSCPADCISLHVTFFINIRHRPGSECDLGNQLGYFQICRRRALIVSHRVRGPISYLPHTGRHRWPLWPFPPSPCFQIPVAVPSGSVPKLRCLSNFHLNIREDGYMKRSSEHLTTEVRLNGTCGQQHHPGIGENVLSALVR